MATAAPGAEALDATWQHVAAYLGTPGVLRAAQACRAWRDRVEAHALWSAGAVAGALAALDACEAAAAAGAALEADARGRTARPARRGKLFAMPADRRPKYANFVYLEGLGALHGHGRLLVDRHRLRRAGRRRRHEEEAGAAEGDGEHEPHGHRRRLLAVVGHGSARVSAVRLSVAAGAAAPADVRDAATTLGCRLEGATWAA